MLQWGYYQVKQQENILRIGIILFIFEDSHFSGMFHIYFSAAHESEIYPAALYARAWCMQHNGWPRVQVWVCIVLVNMLWHHSRHKHHANVRFVRFCYNFTLCTKVLVGNKFTGLDCETIRLIAIETELAATGALYSFLWSYGNAQTFRRNKYIYTVSEQFSSRWIFGLFFVFKNLEVFNYFNFFSSVISIFFNMYAVIKFVLLFSFKLLIISIFLA